MWTTGSDYACHRTSPNLLVAGTPWDDAPRKVLRRGGMAGTRDKRRDALPRYGTRLSTATPHVRRYAANDTYTLGYDMSISTPT